MPYHRQISVWQWIPAITPIYCRFKSLKEQGALATFFSIGKIAENLYGF